MQNEMQSLIVRTGEVRELPSFNWKFETVEIESGGILKLIPRSRGWLILECSGEIQLDGLIDLKNHGPVRGHISARATDGLSLDHFYDSSNRGGNGSDGAHAGLPGAQGRGVPGTIDYGGGGGGGAFSGPRGVSPGEDAREDQGGQRFSRGGNGSRRPGNGGLLYLRCNKLLGAGSIIASGDNGQAGEAGQRYDTFTGAAGSGGGAPGGEGGAIWIRSLEVSSEIRFDVSGGQGGLGGRGSFPLAEQYAGTNGQDGYAGVVVNVPY